MRGRAQSCKNTRNATGLSPMVLQAAAKIAAADQPAGTRVALPGSMCRTYVPRCEAETSL